MHRSISMASQPSKLNDAPGNNAALASAVNAASKDRLVTVLHTLLQECNSAVPILERELLTEDFDSFDLESENIGDTEEDGVEIAEKAKNAPPEKSNKRARAASQTDTAGRPAQKRKLYETCIQCDQEYNVIENHSKACQWHPGVCSSTCPLN